MQEARRAAEAAATRRAAAEAEMHRLEKLHRSALEESSRHVEEYERAKGERAGL